MNRTKFALVLPLCILLSIAFVGQSEAQTMDATSTSSSSENSCPDPVSCPSVPVVSIGLDESPDSFNLGVSLECRQGDTGICVTPGVSFGRHGGNVDYSVIQLWVQGRKNFAVGSDPSLTVTPLVGPRLYRISIDDCGLGDCSNTELALDLGGGVQYKQFGLDLYTGLNGPDLSARLKYFFKR